MQVDETSSLSVWRKISSGIGILLPVQVLELYIRCSEDASAQKCPSQSAHLDECTHHLDSSLFTIFVVIFCHWVGTFGQSNDNLPCEHIVWEWFMQIAFEDSAQREISKARAWRIWQIEQMGVTLTGGRGGLLCCLIAAPLLDDQSNNELWVKSRVIIHRYLILHRWWGSGWVSRGLITRGHLKEVQWKHMFRWACHFLSEWKHYI